MPVFKKRSIEIQNPINGKTYHLVPLANLELIENQLERIATICNEPLVFDTLFSEIFPDGEYPLSSAADWIHWGRTGWQEGSHFTFATIDESGLVAAACDIKSADTESAEIGYWASSLHRGVMTNSVAGMLQLANESGFLSFFAEVRKDNLKSQGVLIRNNFARSTDIPSKQHHILFKR